MAKRVTILSILVFGWDGTQKVFVHQNPRICSGKYTQYASFYTGGEGGEYPDSILTPLYDCRCEAPDDTLGKQNLSISSLRCDNGSGNGSGNGNGDAAALLEKKSGRSRASCHETKTGKTSI